MNKKPRACFFSTEGLEKINQQQYSLQDIKILKDLGFDVCISSSLLDIPWNCDIYFGWWATGSVIPTIVAKLVGRPIIIVAGGNEVQLYRDSMTNAPGGYLASPLYKKIAALLTLNCCDRLTVVSKFMLADVLKLCKRRPVVIYNSVDTDLFYPRSVKREYVTSIFNLEDSVVKLKRGEIFIHAISHVVNSVKDVKFLIIGRRGNAYKHLNNLVESLGIEKNVTFLEPIPNKEIPFWLSRSLCYVQISDTETFGMSVAEAMACSTPIVVSSRGAIPEIVGENGIYVNHNNAISVAEGIIDVLKMSSDQRERIGAILRLRILENFSYECRKEHFSNIINELI